MGMCPSPSLIAAFHVLHRLLVPRHSPHALSSLTIKLVHKQFLSEPPRMSGWVLPKIPSKQGSFITCLYLQFFLQLVDFLHVFSCQTSSFSTAVENKTFLT